MNTKINNKNVKVYKPNTSNTQHSKEHGNSKAISKKSKPNGNITYDNTITNEFHIQKDLQTMDIYDHEWKAIKRIVLKIKSGTSKFSIGSLVDGFLAGILIPFSLDLFKIITTSSPTKDLKGELLFYLACLIIAAILEIIKLCIKPKFLASYTTFNSDIENLNDRISEIDERLKIK